jgi:hypothetical protein
LNFCFDAANKSQVIVMSMNVTLTLDDETAAYLERIAADQGRSVAEVDSPDHDGGSAPQAHD